MNGGGGGPTVSMAGRRLEGDLARTMPQGELGVLKGFTRLAHEPTDRSARNKMAKDAGDFPVSANIFWINIFEYRETGRMY